MKRTLVLAAFLTALLAGGCVGPDGLPTPIGQKFLSPSRQIALGMAVYEGVMSSIVIAHQHGMIPAEALPKIEMVRAVAWAWLTRAKEQLVGGQPPQDALAQAFDALAILVEERDKYRRRLADARN